MFSISKMYNGGIAIVLGFFLFFAGTYAQSPIVVGDGNADSCTEKSFSDAVATALKTAGNQISFNCGPSLKTIKLSKQLWITDSLSIDGNKKIVLDGGSITRHFVVAHPDTKYGISAGAKGSLKAITFTLKNIALINGGGGNVPQNERPNRGNPTSKIINKRDGGSIYLGRNGTLNLDGVIFHNNKIKGTKTTDKAPNNVTYAGGAIFAGNDSVISVSNSYFGNNYSTDEGGAIRADYKPTLSIKNSVFENNGTEGKIPDALGGGGALYYARAVKPVTIVNSYFINNSSQRAGGAIKSHTSETVIDKTYFVENKSARGGAIYNLLSPLTITNSFFIKNSTSRITDKDGAGGAMYVDGVREVDKEGTMKISNTVFDGNTSYLGGGGLSICLYDNQTSIFTSNTLANNISQNYVGGGLYGECAGTHNISDTKLYNNQVPSQSDKNKIERADLFVRDASKSGRGWNVSASSKLKSYATATYQAPALNWMQSTTTSTNPDTSPSTTDLDPVLKAKIDTILVRFQSMSKSNLSSFISQFKALVTKKKLNTNPIIVYVLDRLDAILKSK